MSIDLSQLSAGRIDRIRNADSFEQASKMNILDRLIDTIFRGGAKKEAIRELYSVLSENNSGTPGQMRAFLDMRQLILPEHRHRLQLELTEHADGSCDYTLLLEKQEIYSRKGVDAEEDIAALHHAKRAVQVDDFLIKLQNFDPKAASLVQRSDRFLIEQGKTGDCYVLAAMIGIMSNPAMQENIENMAEITKDGKLRLNFDAEMSARLTESLNFSSEDDLDNETLDNILKQQNELESLSKKGYELSGTDKGLRLEITQDRLAKIINETASAETNSLIVNILEHFVGNLQRYTTEVSVVSPEMEKILLSAGKSQEDIDDMKQNTTQALSPLRSDRESILAHNDRAGHYESLVTTLLGYTKGETARPADSLSLRETLSQFDKQELCLTKGGKQGFVYVFMDYGKADEHGKIHGRHALTLKDIEFDEKGEPTGVFLINPWGTTREPEYYPLSDLLQREAGFIDFHSPKAKIAEDKGVESTQISSRPPIDSPPTFMLFDQFA